MKPILTLVYASLLCMSMTSCSYLMTGNLVRSSYSAADILLKGVRVGVHRNQPILVASLVNINNVQQSSTLGRIVAEQIGSRLVQQGYKVIELKMRTDSVFVQEKTGELLLSREFKNISVQHDANTVVVGTYAKGKEAVYMNIKLVRAQDSVILSSYDYLLPLNPDTKQMLQGR